MGPISEKLSVLSGGMATVTVTSPGVGRVIGKLTERFQNDFYMTDFPLPTDAEARILNQVTPITDVERVALSEAGERVLAKSIFATSPFPHWDNSAMDGYAVRFSDVAESNESSPTPLKIIGESAAGTTPTHSLNPGEASRIFTGAMLPSGADTVVMQEVCEQESGQIWIKQAPSQLGEFVRKQGAYCQPGQGLLGAGQRVGAAEMAILATSQILQVPVFRRPRVALFASGDELISPEMPLTPGKLVDSNTYAITQFLQTQGVKIIALGSIQDDRDALQQAMQTAITSADLVLSTGGVSVGDYDYIPELLMALGGKFIITKVAMKPGKPLKVATFPDHKLYIGIPGNPVSALVTCWRFVQPLLQKLAGLPPSQTLRWVNAQLTAPIRGAVSRETYIWGKLHWHHEGQPLTFAPATGIMASANLMNLAGTNGLAVVPQGVKEVTISEQVKILVVNSCYWSLKVG